jgi:hypothetical protein
MIRTSKFFACRMYLFADRLGFQEVDSLHQAGEFVSEFTGYLLKVQSIKANRCKTGERISHRNERKINGLYDTVIENDRERDDKWSQFEGPKAHCRSKRSFSIQSVVITPFFPCHPFFSCLYASKQVCPLSGSRIFAHCLRRPQKPVIICNGRWTVWGPLGRLARAFCPELNTHQPSALWGEPRPRKCGK